jgi:hypothetical protein
VSQAATAVATPLEAAGIEVWTSRIFRWKLTPGDKNAVAIPQADISIIIPTYRYRDKVVRAVLSALASGAGEIIVVDDQCPAHVVQSVHAAGRGIAGAPHTLHPRFLKRCGKFLVSAGTIAGADEYPADSCLRQLSAGPLN